MEHEPRLLFFNNNFGASSATVLIGAQVCQDVIHGESTLSQAQAAQGWSAGGRLRQLLAKLYTIVQRHTVIQCTLPPGVGSGHVVRVVQSGQISVEENVTVSYELYPKNTFLDSRNYY